MILMSSVSLSDFYVGRHSRSRNQHNCLLARYSISWGIDPCVAEVLYVPEGGIRKGDMVGFAYGWVCVYHKLVDKGYGQNLDNPDTLPIQLLETTFKNKYKIKASRNCC